MSPLRIKVPRWVGVALSRRLARSTTRPGSVVPPPAPLALTRRSLLYFKSEGCAPCDGIDLFIGRLAASAGLDLRVIDARRGQVLEHGYGGPLLLDRTGEIGRAYGVQVFPTLLVTTAGGEVERVLVGGEADEHVVRERLGLE